MLNRQFDIPGLPDRPARPRSEGLTLALDKGFSPRQAEDFMDAASDFVDLVKLGWGTAVITPNLRRKLDVYREAGVPVYFGGTLFEAFFLRNALDMYRRVLEDLKMEHIEISDGTLSISSEEKLQCIESFGRGFTVLSEVGSKDAEHIMPPYKWVEQIKQELAAGSWRVICEARESGTAGLFRPNGEVRSGLVDEIVDLVDHNKLVFEAPNKAQQVWFIRQLGANVNLGNIRPEEVIALETLRLGLRADTLFEFFSGDGLPRRDDQFNGVARNKSA